MRTKRKILSVLLVLAIFSGIFAFNPKEVKAAAVVYDPLYMLIEFVIKPLVRKIANSLENKLVNRTNKLLSNIDGRGPSFISNWRNYTLNSQARGNDIFRAMLADATVCPYFKNSLQKAFLAEKSIGALSGASVVVKDPKTGRDVVAERTELGIPGEPSFKQIMNCSLPPDFDVKGFRENFNKGGWATWNKLIEPQNNFFGAFAQSLNERTLQIGLESQTARDESMAGSGFLSQRLGKGIGEAGLGPSGCIGTNRFKMDEKGNLAPVWTGSRCTFLGKAVTPGKILGETAANTLDTKLKRVGGATFLTDIILSLFAAVVDGTTSRLANFAGQYTFDGPPSVPEAVPRVGSFDEKRFEPGADDPNFDPEIKRAREAGEAECKNSCIQREQEGCATTIDPVTGEETRDQACMEAAESVCNSKCSQITAPVNPYD